MNDGAAATGNTTADAGVVEEKETGLNVDDAVSDIASSLGFNGDDHGSDAGANGDEDAGEAPASSQADAAADKPAATDKPVAATTAPVVRQAPKSWPKEKHEVWGKMAPEAQEFYELREKQMLDGIEQYKGDAGFGKAMREVTQPYKAFITSQGADEPKAVQFLLNAHYRLSTATPEQRNQYFAHLAKSYGVDLGTVAKTGETQQQVDPHVQALTQKVDSLQSSLTQREQHALAEAQVKVAKEVEAFASDPKHVYFDECADDIVALINAGHTLDEAYDKAVYANPVTRAKELARLQADNEKMLREKAKAEADAARKAAGNNVRSSNTRKAPTEPKGTMEDTMRATLRNIRERTTH